MRPLLTFSLMYSVSSLFSDMMFFDLVDKRMTTGVMTTETDGLVMHPAYVVTDW